MDDEERSELLGKLFSLMTAKLEDAAALAADGQGLARSSVAAAAEKSQEIRSLAEEVGVLAEAASAVAQNQATL